MVALAPSLPARSAELPAWRLNALRCAYLLLIVGLGIQVWPGIVLRHAGWELMEGVVQCMLGALSLLALLGLRHPLRMLPLLLFEMAWKAIWLAVVAAPKWASGQMDEGTLATTFACLLVVVFPLVVPWRHVVKTLVLDKGDRWR
ncbi:hypothetical protein [Caulobacter hibisci]|uniref:Uncharacterized protein n=1 Tax=Caulobacter hibisci TaxID=2035993 RepID=A0ABS0SV71_9CAUL|nr:hypothetical protein [Caulobacter hibisci]MBI1682573.1 hypothetical protein [Caulobacter hibisci]